MEHKNIFFNSSMPRSCSTLLQNVLMQNPTIFATQTDPVLEYLYAARINYTDSTEVKAQDANIALKNWRGFCWGGLNGYATAYTDRPNICIKTRGGTIHYNWFKQFMPYQPKMICMVRNLKAVIASMEMLFRTNVEKHQPIENHAQLSGNNTLKRIDSFLASPPIGLALDRIKDCFQQGINKHVLYIRAEDFCSFPTREVNKIYNYLELPEFKHNFDNVEQYTQEDDSVYGLSPNLHTIRNVIQPIKDNSISVLGVDACSWIDNNYQWYQQLFNY